MSSSTRSYIGKRALRAWSARFLRGPRCALVVQNSDRRSRNAEFIVDHKNMAMNDCLASAEAGCCQEATICSGANDSDTLGPCTTPSSQTIDSSMRAPCSSAIFFDHRQTQSGATRLGGHIGPECTPQNVRGESAPWSLMRRRTRLEASFQCVLMQTGGIVSARSTRLLGGVLCVLQQVVQ